MTRISEDNTHIRTFGTQWLEKVYFSNKNQIANSVATFQRPSAVAVWKEDPFNIVSVLLLEKRLQSMEVTGEEVNRGAGYGLEMHSPTSSVVQGLTLKHWQR